MRSNVFVTSALAPDGVKPWRVLVVDDEEGMRHMVTLMLERHGFRVSASANGREALERLADGDIDIVLSDMRMPELDGLGLLKSLRE
ncbi:MAG: response regulator, partial [Clostridia bacterium]|nr:response regulator [Deltaproteobacteria bacterium]